MVQKQQRAAVLNFVIATFLLWAGQSAALQPIEGQPQPAPLRHSTPPHPIWSQPTPAVPLLQRGRAVSALMVVASCCAGLQVRVPAGYAQLADSDNVREQLRRTRGPAAEDHHTTVLYTMDGGVYYKR